MGVSSLRPGPLVRAVVASQEVSAIAGANPTFLYAAFQLAGDSGNTNLSLELNQLGTTFHNGLVVLHYDQPAVSTVMQPGMTFTIEPMINLGSLDYEIWDDGWTVVTRDRKWTAQFEHTLLVTDTGVEILTLP